MCNQCVDTGTVARCTVRQQIEKEAIRVSTQLTPHQHTIVINSKRLFYYICTGYIGQNAKLVEDVYFVKDAKSVEDAVCG